MIRVVKGLVFYPMLWLRGILIWLLLALSGLFLLGGIFMWIVTGLEFGTGLMLGLSFVLFLFRQAYDHILIKINPTDNFLYLSQ